MFFGFIMCSVYSLKTFLILPICVLFWENNRISEKKTLSVDSAQS